MILRPMVFGDVGDVSLIHKAVFQGGQRTAYLPQHVLERYYQSLLAHLRYCYVAMEAPSTIGFVIAGGSGDLARARSTFIRRCAPSLLYASARNPQLMKEVLRGGVRRILRRRRTRGSGGRSLSDREAPRVTLFSVAVHPDYQKRAVGRRLVLALHAYLVSDNHPAYEASVRKTNVASRRLFESLGGTVVRENAATVVYRVVLSNPASVSSAS